ncbi:MAG: hypothetical protein IJ766_08290 [Clostridia bacterium]|nr:hypothetical protein [Clostridia bacterium]
MKKNFLRVISVCLCIVLMASVGAVGVFAADKRTACGADCAYYPTIIVPGLGQSSVVVLDDDGDFLLDKDGNKISAFPAYIQTKQLVKRAFFPALLSLLTQRDAGLSNAVADAIGMSFGINASDLYAQNTGNVQVEKFPYSYAECNDYERGIINSHIPFDLYPTDLPLDHLYYFSYNSFGNHIDIVNELYTYIQMVKVQTGHRKVNLVPLSQGGTVVSAMLDYYPQVSADLHKVLFVVPALDGSKLIGDVFNDRITFLDSDYLYHGFLEDMRLLDEKTAGLIEVLLRLLPDSVIINSLQKGVKCLVEDVMIRSTSMWALCPSGDYPSAAERYLSSPEMAAIRSQTDRYYQAQLHARDNIQTLTERGVQVFCVAEYDYALINVGENWNTENADFIIQLDSTSMGAYAANVGETLPEGYEQKNTHCSDPTHHHISPDHVVDASAGLLPDTTFYFDAQRHDLTQYNDVILKLAMELIAHDDITDVYADPAFPQFNNGRNVKTILPLLSQAKDVDAAKLSGDKAKALTDAIAQSEEVLSRTVGAAGEIEAAEQALTDALVNAGVVKANKKGKNIFTPISEWLYAHYGTKSFSEIPRAAVRNVLQSITDFFRKTAHI